MREVDRLGWAVTVPLLAGDHVLGVRANTHELGRLLSSLFADRLVPETAPPGNISVYVAKEAVGGPQELHRLYATHTRRIRTRSVRRILGGLWHELDTRDERAARRSLMVDATVVVRDERAHLLPAALRRSIVDNERRWSKHGFRLVDRRWLVIDVAAGTVSLPRPRLKWDAEVADQIADMDLADRETEPASEGSIQIASWNPTLHEGSLADRVALAGEQLLDRRQLVPPEVIRSLAELLARLPQVDAPDADRARLPQRLAEI